MISIVQYKLIPYLQYVLSFIVHLNITTNIYLCVCECIPDSLKMVDWEGWVSDSALYCFLNGYIYEDNLN